jgi:LysM repeat protein
MKIIQKANLLTLFFCLHLAMSRADTYILFDPSCMDRLEFAYDFTPPGSEYVKYQIKISPTEYVIMEVPSENSSPKQSLLPGQAIGCGDQKISRQMADNIFNNREKVFMVRRTSDNQYQISQVMTAGYFRRDSRGVVYDHWQFSFQHTGGLTIGENLTKGSNTGTTVTYEGPTRYECADAYLFKITFDFDPNAFREMIFIPSIGVVEERSSAGKDNIYRVKTVNGQAFAGYLQKLCASGIAASPDFLLAAGSTGGGMPGGSTPGLPDYHEVERGETLFSISRKYNISVDQLKEWNGLSSNAISVGQRLRTLPSGYNLAEKGSQQ